MSQSRRLVAIMFTDIVGYTALMEQDEQRAFEVLKRNLSIHQSEIKAFGGRLIKELGDGILASFLTVSDALNAAIRIQEQCNKTEFKLSIGIHQGEVVFENGDIFGDAVNVASRIQSLGTAGCILFSKKITDEIKNKSEFRTVSLGRFEFKNVNEPIEVFALANDGFAVPAKNRMKGKLKDNSKKRVLKFGLLVLLIISFGLFGYYTLTTLNHNREVTAIRNGAIAIIPFENQTGRSELNSIGQVAADFISTNLIQNQFWKVIPTQEVFRKTIYAGVLTNSEAEKQITDQSSIDYLVVGHYNLIGDSIMLVASVNHVVENKILYTTPVIKCSITNPMKVVTDAQQFILGYLMFSTEKESLITRPPKYDAYQVYLKGMEVWTKNNLGPGNIGERTGSEIEMFFKSSIAIDKDFLPPYFKLAELFSIDRKFKRLDSVLQILETKRGLFLEGDNLNFSIQKLTISRNWNALENFLLTKTEVGTSDFRPYYLLAANALYRQNKPQKALNYIARCNLEEFDFENKPADQLFYSLQATALTRLKQFDKVEALTNTFNFEIKIPELLAKRWLALYFLGKKDQVSQELTNYYGLKAKNVTDYHTTAMSVFRAAQLMGDSAYMHSTYNLYSEFIKSWDQKVLETSWDIFPFAVMMFRTKVNIPEAENLLSKDLVLVARPRRMHQLGILYAATDRENKAREVIADLLSRENKFDNGLTRYYVAKIEAELGNKEKSVEYLRQSVSKGMEFREELFEFDADLKNLFDYPPFIELVTPKE